MINEKIIKENFIDNYYKTISNEGVSKIANFYINNAVCMINSNLYDNANTMIIDLLHQSHDKYEYYDWSCSVQELKDSLLLNIVGKFIVINLNGDKSDLMNFSETFILIKDNNKLLISNYMLKTF
jgi:hypothetical protein